MSPDSEDRPISLLDVLSFMPTGKATLSFGGHPIITVDADRKTVEVETERAGEAGIRLKDLVKVEEGGRGVLRGSIHATRTLTRLGWRLNLYTGGEKLLSLGSGVSRLTGGAGINPLKLRKLLDLLR